MPEHASSAGGEVVEFANSIGMNLDPEQELVLDGMFAEKANGKWASIEDAVIANRQNLKTHVKKAAALAHLYLFDARLITWSAHLFTTTQEAHRDLKELIENNDFLDRRVKKITDANGEEAIELFGDRRILFKARTKTGGRGLTGDVVILDEAFALTAAMTGSLIPAQSARPNPKIIYGSSAGHAGSAILRGIRDRGRAGGDDSLFYIEFCAEQRPCESERCDHRYGSVGCSYDDEELWHQANSALGRRITIEFVRVERRSLPATEFARERLGYWEDPEASVEGLPLEKWHACADADAELDGELVWVVSIAHDQTWSTIAAAGLSDFEFVYGEVVEYRPGTDWVAGRLVELRAEHGAGRVKVDMAGPRSTVPDELDMAGVEWEPVTAQELVDSCGVFESLILRDLFRHIEQPELTFAIKEGRRRPVGDGAWTWARRASPVEISPAIAVTIGAAAVVQGDTGDGGPEIW